MIARETLDVHSFLGVTGQLVMGATGQAEVAPASRREVVGRHLGERWVALDENGATSGGDGGDAGRAGAGEWIEHGPTRGNECADEVAE